MGYGNRIRAKYTAKWGVQIAGMIFQTRSRTAYTQNLLHYIRVHTFQIWQCKEVLQITRSTEILDIFPPKASVLLYQDDVPVSD